METEAEPPVKRVKKENFFALHSAMAELNTENEYCDVTIQIDEQSFKSHRFVLAALSEYFHKMFAGNFKEKHIKNESIVLHEMDADAFKLILDFMYSGDVKITEQNVFSLLTTADFLKLRNPYIEKKCIEYIHEHIWVLELIPNAMKIFEFSCVTKKAPLINVMRKYICQHMHQLSQDDVFEMISYEDLKQLLPPECPFWIYNQDIVLNFLIGWVHHSHKKRKSHFKELVKLIDFKKISTPCISFLLEEYEELIGRFEDVEGADNTGSKLFSPSYVIDNARSEATITFVIDNFSTFIKKEGHKSLTSLPCMIQNLPWRLNVGITEKNGKRSVAVYLQCDGYSTIENWSCRATFHLTILPDFTKRSNSSDLYEEGKKNWGWPHVASLDDIINPEKGRVKDDIIIFQAQVIADPPQLGT